MESLFTVFLSNRAETLFQGFKERLFASTRPFSKRVVIVPSAAMKSWLMQQMAHDEKLGICAGVQMGYVEPTLNSLSSLLIKNKALVVDHYRPSEIELALALEDAIANISSTINTLSTAKQQGWQPLLQYLDVKGNSLSRRSAKRAGALATTLAKLYIEYGKYGSQMVTSWQNSKTVHWQQLLWQKMEELFNNWDYPCRQFEDIEIIENISPEELQIHVFGLSYLAPLHHRFLLQIANHVPVHYYMLSPCHKFWSDLLSEKESVHLKKYWHRKQVQPAQLEALDDYLRDNNPLLANFGRLGREMARQLEAHDFLMEEHYSLPQTVLDHEAYQDLIAHEIELREGASALTMLEAVQADMALLRNPDSTSKIVLDANDRSIQVHAAPKPMREVEVIYNVIMGIIEKHAHDESPIVPGDIIVMASNLSAYEPFIRTVFEAPESQLDIQLMDVQTPSQNSLVRGFLHLINLPDGRWEAHALMQLLNNEAFSLSQGFTSNDIQQIYSWIKDAGIRWGKDPNHRNELLKRDHCAKEMVEECWQGTWEHGLGRLLDGLAISPSSTISDDFEFSPLDGVEINQSELLGTFMSLLRSLHADLKPLIDDTKLTLKDWSEYLTCICKTYFKSANREEEEGLEILQNHLLALGKAGSRLTDQIFAFHSIKRQLEQAINSSSTLYKESNLQAVRFCSLLPMRAVPAKVAILIGMSDGEFPRTEQAQSLNLLSKENQGDYCPLQIDLDRYLFLEALLSARLYFIVSYSSQKPGDINPQQPSLLVTELLSYIEKAYHYSGSIVYKHPLCAFHRSYFSMDNSVKNYLYSRYKEAAAHYYPDKKLSHTFLPNFTSEVSITAPAETTQHLSINLADLTAFTRSPLKVYFNKTLDVYLEKMGERQIKNNEDLLVSHLETALLLKDAVHLPTKSLMSHALKTERVPKGPFRIVETNRLSREIEVLKENLQSHGIMSEEIKTIEFNQRYQKVQTSTSGWQVPPLYIEVPDVGTVCIVGLIEKVSTAGLIAVAKDDLKEAVKVWPTWLVFCCLIKQYELPISSQLIFARGEKPSSKNGDVGNPETLLKRFLEYYYKGIKNPSPLMPECISDLLAGKFDKFADVFNEQENEFNPIYDEYLKWLKRNSPGIDLAKSSVHWQGVAKSLFVDMSQVWYPKNTIAEKA